MKYDVLKDFEDKDFAVADPNGEGKVPLSLTVGEVFIPAKYNYPLAKRATLVDKGVLKLIEA